MTSKKNRKGRPKGSLNREYELATVEIPATCPKCGSASMTQLKGAPPIYRNHSGVLPAGVTYERVRWVRKKCVCGQMLIVKTYYPAKQ